MKSAGRAGSGSQTGDQTTRSVASQTAIEPRPVELRSSRTNVPGNATPGQNGERSNRRSVSGTSTVSFEAGDEVFNAASGHGMVYIVRAGCVRLYKLLPKGRSINLGILGPNTVFTQEDTTGIASGAVAETMVDSTILIVPVDELVNVITSSPELAASMVTGMTRRLTEMQTLVAHLLVRDASIRLAVTLITLATRFGRPAADGFTCITIPLTHDVLANMIGSNRVTVSRKLRELQGVGLLRSTGHHPMAVDIDGMRQFAQSAPYSK